jgi:hypothetical protein
MSENEEIAFFAVPHNVAALNKFKSRLDAMHVTGKCKLIQGGK